MLYNGIVFGEQVTVDMVKGTTPSSVLVLYSCSFVHIWTAATHPNDYPSSPHWSPMVMTSHNEDYTMWSGGSKATRGVKGVAEVYGLCAPIVYSSCTFNCYFAKFDVNT